MRRERLRGGLPVVDAPALAKKQNASALFFTRRRKGVSLLSMAWANLGRSRGKTYKIGGDLG
mgnify:CR=1 FL=1